MKPILFWCGACAVILIGALVLAKTPESWQGLALTIALFLVNALLLIKVCIGSR